MKRRLIAFSILFILFFIPQSALADRKVINYQSEINYPPYKFDGGGYLTGFDIDISNLIFNNEDYALKLSVDSWDKVYERLENGEIDTCGMLVVNDERKKEILFSKPLFKTYTAAFTRKGFEKIEINSLGNYRVGVGKGQYSEILLRDRLMVKNYKTYNTISDAIEALKNGQIDVLFENQEVVNFLIVEKGLRGEIGYQINNLYPQEVAYGFNKSRVDLLQYTDRKIEDMRDSGVFEDIYERYFFKKSEYYRESQRRKIILGAVGLLLSVLVGVILVRLYIKRLHRELYNEKELLKDILDNASLFIIAVDSYKNIIKCNKSISKFGLKYDEVLNRKYDELVEIDRRFNFIIEMLDDAIEYKFSNNKEISILDESGEETYYSFRTSAIYNSEGRADILLLAGVDITEIKGYQIKLKTSYNELEATYEELVASEEELKEQYDEIAEGQEKLRLSEERFRIASEASNDAIWEEIPSENKIYYSDRWYELLGYEKSYDDVGLWMELVHPEDGKRVQREVDEHFEGRTSVYKCEYRIRAKHGSYKWFFSRGKAIRDSEGKIIRFIGSSTDITEVKDYEFKLKRMAFFDQLTGLPNKASFREELDKITKAYRGAALIYIDLDNFKYINDTMGHSYGDSVLVKTGRKIAKIIDDKGCVFRLGGDEFSVIVFDIENRRDIEAVAEDILEGFREPIEIGEVSINVSPSIGISIYPQDSLNSEELIVNSDIAMYKSKEAGRGTYTFFGEYMRQSIERRIAIEKHLSAAIEKDELYLLYQPQFDIRTGKIDGFEALIRWESPVLGNISPLTFIKIAEESRLIIPLGEWVIKRACRFVKNLELSGFTGYRMSINISSIQLMQHNFEERVMDILGEVDLSPELLEFEITESILMESFEYINRKLDILKSKGIRIALDDFGTGYSSLNYLRLLKVNTLKIDKSFIDDILENDESKSLTSAIIDIGHKVGLQVVAEGVENEGQLKFLAQNNCDKIQGYFFSKPVFEEDIINMIK